MATWYKTNLIKLIESDHKSEGKMIVIRLAIDNALSAFPNIIATGLQKENRIFKKLASCAFVI